MSVGNSGTGRPLMVQLALVDLGWLRLSTVASGLPRLAPVSPGIARGKRDPGEFFYWMVKRSFALNIFTSGLKKELWELGWAFQLKKNIRYDLGMVEYSA